MSEAGRGSMSLRLEIFPDDLDATVDFYTRALGFKLERDERTSDAPYVVMRRGGVLLGAARRTDRIDPATRRPPCGTEIVPEVQDVVAERDLVASLWPLEEDPTSDLGGSPTSGSWTRPATTSGSLTCLL